MKKLIVAIAAIFYLGASVGTTVHLHYCMNKLVKWGLSHNKEKKCSNCGMEKNAQLKSNCCKDEQKRVKLDNDQKITTTFLFTGFVADLPVYNEKPYLYITSSITENFPVSHAPPLNRTALYIRHCVFLI